MSFKVESRSKPCCFLLVIQGYPGSRLMNLHPQKIKTISTHQSTRTRNWVEALERKRRGTRLEDAEFQPICCIVMQYEMMSMFTFFFFSPFLDLEQMASSYSSYSFLLATFLFQPLNPLKWLLNIHALYLQNFYPCTYADCACVRGFSIDRIIGRQRRAVSGSLKSAVSKLQKLQGVERPQTTTIKILGDPTCDSITHVDNIS